MWPEGSPSPHLGGVQAHNWEEGVPRPTPEMGCPGPGCGEGGLYHSMH